MSTEVVGQRNGLEHQCVADCGSITTIHADRLGRHLGYLLPDQEPALLDAMRNGFDLA